MEPVTLKFGESSGPNSAAGQALTAYAERVAERTDGKVKIEFFFANSLLESNAIFPALGDGVADIATVAISQSAEQLPVMNWISAGSSTLSPEFPLSQMQALPAETQVFSDNADVTNELDDQNVKMLLAGLSGGFSPAVCSKPVRNLDDAKGVRIRVVGELHAQEARALGMEPVQTSSSEIFEALQRGVIDCATASDGGHNFIALGLLDVAEYYLPLKLSPTGGTSYQMNLDSWTGLPEEAQKILLEELGGYAADRLRGNLEGYGEMVDLIDERGIEWLDASDLNRTLREAQEKNVEEIYADPPNAVSDPDTLINEYEEALATWLETIQDFLTAEPLAADADPETMKEAYRNADESIDFEGLSQELGSYFKDLAG
ncbi:TRAP transporter substrate-binding protein DctP [Aeromicrobium sp. YIM 150415]|uniref:TRAP transporter substrate-binding protein DctP n=1 Tax=Aeromicrobium sp. YIM 150415 TaxID=2803912 RepID=UPI001964513A|nr:TRAP transporter substrate-binding protein DctP [Aeromicrobium sp. YIM 150415]MBM9464072.1 TRAP transporter substrate-binding protein DctP [Aeromicrobium sp. YIM 150415]